MSRDTFLNEALYEADKSLDKFGCSATGVCEFTRRQMKQTVNRKCMFCFVILHSVNINLIVNSEM